MDTGKKYNTQCTGDALDTVNAHTKDQDITLYASCFCPFVQRVWVALEVLEIPYKYYEVDPYLKTPELLEVSPRGLVPALKIFAEKGHKFDPPTSLNESTVILEYLEALASPDRSLLPPRTEPYAYALAHLQADHVNRALVPAFYRFAQARAPDARDEYVRALDGLVALLERPQTHGLWTGPGELGWVDIMTAPWLFRTTNVLKIYRGFETPAEGKLADWMARIFAHPAFKRTCSTEELYLDSYERYAFNRPDTSMVATAINEGKSLP